MATRIQWAARLARLEQRIEAEQRAAYWVQPVTLPSPSSAQMRTVLKTLIEGGAAFAKPGNVQPSHAQVTLLQLLGWDDAAIETYFRALNLNHEGNDDEEQHHE